MRFNQEQNVNRNLENYAITAEVRAIEDKRQRILRVVPIFLSLVIVFGLAACLYLLPVSPLYTYLHPDTVQAKSKTAPPTPAKQITAPLETVLTPRARVRETETVRKISRDLDSGAVRDLLRAGSGLESKKNAAEARQTAVQTGPTQVSTEAATEPTAAATVASPSPTATTVVETTAEQETTAVSERAAKESPSEVEDGFYDSVRTLYIAGDTVNLRREADLNAKVLARMELGESVQELKRNSSWSYVRLNDGLEGFIFTNLMDTEPVVQQATPVPEVKAEEFAPHEETYYSHFSAVRVRQEPNTSSNIMGELFYGAEVKTLGYTAGWFLIRTADGKTGYVYGDFLKKEAVPQEELRGEAIHDEKTTLIQANYDTNPETTTGGLKVANLARQYLGCDYVYGGTTPDGFDCSGFVQYLYRAAGVNLGRTTYDQVYDGIPVNFGYGDFSTLVPGDILLFAEGSDVFHSGIYIGNGQMIHAGTPSTGVLVENLSMGFYAERLAYVRRIFY